MTDIVRRLERALADRYEVEGRLGAGATAVVVLARDRRHERQVALKVLRPDFAETLGTARFLREIRLVASFTHPRILPLHDSGEADGLLWYSMPLARGGSLRSLLSQQRPLPIDESVRIALQVASALDYAHGRGVVHRDIKPENILIEDGEVLLTDFGLARTGQPSTDVGKTDPGLAVGTPVYMSPEQAAGLPSDARADIYALACVLYEMIDGEPPFSGRTAQAVLARHRTEPPRNIAEGRTDVSPHLRAVLERGLAKLPADRFATAGAFADALRIATADELPVATDMRTLDGGYLRPWWRRPETLTTAAISLALGLGLALFGEGGESLFSTPALGVPAADALAPSPADDPRRLAVLYLRNLSPERLSSAVSDGLSEELIDELAKVEALSVTSESGVERYRGDSPDAREVGRRLRVHTVVEGNVLAVGDSVRVTLRLVDARDGRPRRSLTITRARAQLAALGGSVAQALANELRRVLGPTVVVEPSRARTFSADAWEALQTGRRMIRLAEGAQRERRQRDADVAFSRADSLFAHAASVDAEWGDPLVARAHVRLLQAASATGDLSLPRAQFDTLTTDALALLTDASMRRTDQAAVAHERGLAHWMRWHALGDYSEMERAEQSLRRATSIRPDMADAWLWLSEVYHFSGRIPEASVAARHALEADAWLDAAPTLYNRLFLGSMEMERFGEAAEWCRTGRERFLGNPLLAECALHLAARSGLGDSAIAEAWRALATIEASDSAAVLRRARPTHRLWVAAVIARSGHADSARRVADRAVAGLPPAERLQNGLFEAYVALQNDDVEMALDTLQRFLAAHPQDRAFVAQTALFRRLRQDPRFQLLVRRSV